MKHVGQGFDVHQTMLDGDIEKSWQGETVAHESFGIESCPRKLFVESCPDLAHVIAHSGKIRPVGGLIGGQSAANRVDTEGEQAIKFRMKTLQSEDVFVQQVPVKSLEMSDVEDDSEALRNRALEDGVRLDDVKQ